MPSVIDIERYQHFRAAWQDLTPQQRRVVELRCQGMTNQKAGDRLCVSPQTVKNHITAAIRHLHEAGVVDQPGSRGTMDAVCWRIGYESAVRDLAHLAAERKAG